MRSPRLWPLFALFLALSAALPVAALTLRPGGNGTAAADDLALPVFELRTSGGKLVRSEGLRGSAVVVAPIDTQCTDACPVIGADVRLAFDRLTQRERRSVRALAISVDPAGDTAAAVRGFLARHRLEGRLDYLVGPRRSLVRLWHELGITPSAGRDDNLHSAPVRVFDRAGAHVSTLHAGRDLSAKRLTSNVRAALER